MGSGYGRRLRRTRRRKQACMAALISGDRQERFCTGMLATLGPTFVFFRRQEIGLGDVGCTPVQNVLVTFCLRFARLAERVGEVSSFFGPRLSARDLYERLTNAPDNCFEHRAAMP